MRVLPLSCLSVIIIAATVHATPAPPMAADLVLKPLLPRPGDGTVTATFHTAITGSALPHWPVPLRGLDELRRICSAESCERWDKLELALQQAAGWIASYAEGPPRFDAAVVLSQIRQTIDSAALREAFEKVRAIADRDHDHPHRRFWDPDMRSPAEATSRWRVPAAGEPRVNMNYVVHEALFCREHGWRAQTTAYICGPMRDDGGYQTTHAAWALFVAYRNGCLQDTDYTACARSLHAELKKAQAGDFQPKLSLDIDLYAERVLQSVLTGLDDASVEAWIGTLMKLQNSDGSWGFRREGEDPYFRYHTTMTSTWAITEWYRRMVAYPELRLTQKGNPT